MPAITTLNLSENKVSDLTDMGTKFTTLTTLDLSKNEIVEVAGLNGLKSLTSINLSDNKIKSVADLALAFDPEKLKTLNLSGNSEINDWSKITTIYKSVTGKPSSSESSEASSDSSDTSK